MQEEDMAAEVEMYFRQIIALTDLMLEYSNADIPNILTIGGFAQAGLEKQLKLCAASTQSE